jgi:hypothetical protein
MRASKEPINSMLENILRINSDIIYTSDTKNAEEIKEIMKIYRQKDIEIKKMEDDYATILTSHPGKNILLISNEETGQNLRKSLYGNEINLTE